MSKNRLIELIFKIKSFLFIVVTVLLKNFIFFNFSKMRLLRNSSTLYFAFYFINSFFCNVNSKAALTADVLPVVDNKNQIWLEIKDLDKSLSSEVNVSLDVEDSKKFNFDNVNIFKFLHLLFILKKFITKNKTLCVF